MKNNEVKIRYILNDRLDNSYHKILIFNNENKLLFDGYTDVKGSFLFQAPYFGIYKIIILTKEKTLCKVMKILVRKNKNNYFLFKINNKKINLQTVTFWVTDKNYKGLPLKKGEMILWQKNT